MLFLLSILFADMDPAAIKDAQQLIVVTTQSWQSSNGILQRYELKNHQWSKVGTPHEVIMGKNGLGWGIGLHKTPQGAAMIKHEGDGRAPAGIFRLGNGFGYADLAIKYPYKVYKHTDHCIDDSRSRWYNQIIDSTKTSKDYNSFEPMHFAKEYYKYGLVVGHNPGKTPMAGSCIFMHLKKPNRIPTVGCTSMSEQEMTVILKWLDPDKYPLLIQAPSVEIRSLLPADIVPIH